VNCPTFIPLLAKRAKPDSKISTLSTCTLFFVPLFCASSFVPLLLCLFFCASSLCLVFCPSRTQGMSPTSRQVHCVNWSPTIVKTNGSTTLRVCDHIPLIIASFQRWAGCSLCHARCVDLGKLSLRLAFSVFRGHSRCLPEL